MEEILSVKQFQIVFVLIPEVEEVFDLLQTVHMRVFFRSFILFPGQDPVVVFKDVVLVVVVEVEGPSGDAVFLATGGKVIVPKADGVDKENVVMAYDVIRGEKAVKGSVVIVGGGLTGLETAEVIFREYDPEKVTVIDMIDQIGSNMYPSIFVDVTRQMTGKPLELRSGLMLKEVKDDGIIARDLKGDKDIEIKADCVVIAAGVRNDDEIIRTFEKEFDRVIPLGQTHRNPGRIAASMSEAYIAARGFDPLV